MTMLLVKMLSRIVALLTKRYSAPPWELLGSVPALPSIRLPSISTVFLLVVSLMKPAPPRPHAFPLNDVPAERARNIVEREALRLRATGRRIYCRG